MGAVRVNGNTLVGWDTSADLEFDTSVSFPTPSFAHPVTVEADTADPGATLVIDNASQTGEDKDVLTFRITVTFGSLPVRVYTLRVTIDALFSFGINGLPESDIYTYHSITANDSNIFLLRTRTNPNARSVLVLNRLTHAVERTINLTNTATPGSVAATNTVLYTCLLYTSPSPRDS